MYFRFAAAVVLAALIAVAGVAIEKRCLALRRALTRERYRYDVLSDLYARQRLRTQQLGAPARLFESIESDRCDMIAREPITSRRDQVASEPTAVSRE
jgi:hypothetical protein